MSSSTKSLVTIWISSFLTFGILALYMLPRQEEINAPGELGENFAAVGFSLLAILVLVSAGLLLFNKRKQ